MLLIIINPSYSLNDAGDSLPWTLHLPQGASSKLHPQNGPPLSDYLPIHQKVPVLLPFLGSGTVSVCGLTAPAHTCPTLLRVHHTPSDSWEAAAMALARCFGRSRDFFQFVGKKTVCPRRASSALASRATTPSQDHFPRWSGISLSRRNSGANRPSTRRRVRTAS